MKLSIRGIPRVSRADALEAAPRVIAAISVVAILGLAACHTTAGAGKDISAAGNALTNSAQQNTP
jgi:predicted small secreted protein